MLIAAAAGAQEWQPIETRNHRALSLPFLRLNPTFGILEPGKTEWSAGWTVANDIKRFPKTGAPVVEEDQETSRITYRYRKGWRQGSEWWVEAAFLSRGGGFLDPIIDGWHKHVLGWSDPLRDDTPFGRSIVRVGGQTYGSAAGIGDLTLGISQSLGGRYQIDAAVKAPTGDASKLLGSGGADAGALVSGMFGINSRWKVLLQAGAVWQGKPSRLEGARDVIDQEAICFIYHPSAKDTWVAQWQSEASALRTGQPGSDAAHRVVTFGYRRRISSTQWLEGFFTEDRDLANRSMPAIANLGPDFTMGLRLISRM